MKIDKEALIKHINNLKITRDISFREIERQSGVHNVSRIVSGEIKNPTAESWQLLHEAFPADVPEPHYIKGGKVFKNISDSQIAGKTVVNANQGISLSSSEQALIDGLRKLGEKEDETIFEFLGMISKKLIRPDEIAAMLEHSAGLLRAYLLVLLYTGMRPSEAAGLWWEQPAGKDWLRGYVDLARGGFSMVGTKTETRFVPAHPILVETLSKLPRTTPLVFIPVLYIGHQRPYMHFRKAFESLKRKAGIYREIITLYSFRHTARSKMEECGISTAIAETIIGHSNRDFKFTYIHLGDDVLIREIAKLRY